MSHNLTDTPSFTPDGVAVPDDGDDLDAISVEVGFQELANRTAKHEEQLDGITFDGTHTTVGHELNVSNSALFLGTVTAIQPVRIGNILTGSGPTDPVPCGGIACTTIAATGTISTTASIVCTGSITATGSIIGNSNLIIAGSAVISGTTTLQGATALNGQVTHGKWIDRVLTAADGDATVVFANYDLINTLSYTGDHTITISDSGAADDMNVVVVNPTTHTLTVKLPDTSDLVTITGGLYPKWVRCWRILGVWRFFENNL